MGTAEGGWPLSSQLVLGPLVEAHPSHTLTSNPGRNLGLSQGSKSYPGAFFSHATSLSKVGAEVPLQKIDPWLTGCPLAPYLCVYLGPAVFPAQQVTLSGASYLSPDRAC